jgi:hypothetical protein
MGTNQMDSPLSQLYKSLADHPLEPTNSYYVPILGGDPGKDPILALQQRIDLAESESVHLLTGFRGNGKSTQLRRLKNLLEQSKCEVFLLDMLDYVLMTKPLGISDFILSLLASVAGAVEQSEFNLNPLHQGLWERFSNFLKTDVKLEDVDIKGGFVEIGAKLKTDLLFKEKIQKHVEGHLTRFVREAHEFVDKLVCEIRKQKKDEDLKVVLLVDSLEQLRGVGTEAQAVYDSVLELFSGQAASLSFPKLHVVYTVPPYLPVMSHNPGRILGGSGVTQWPNIHVRDKNGKQDHTGLQVMEDIISRRFPDWEKFISKSVLHEFAGVSGGDIRDFFRLVREVAVQLIIARQSRPEADLDAVMVKRVIQQLKNEYFPLAENDARWLGRIYKQKEPSLPDTDVLQDLARFFDSNLIMNYLNGEYWYDIHPLLVDEIEKINSSEKS